MTEVYVEEAALVTLVDGYLPVPGPAGPPGTAIKGELADPSELPLEGDPGDAYLIAGHLWVWTGEAWEDAGPFQGPTGAPGAQGPPGATGAPGEPGPQGDPGAPGAPGADSTVPGPTGPQGVQGIQGSAGVKGDTGAQGPTGPVGADSTVPGPQGFPGPIGPPGASGPTGPPGATGPQGVKGDTGATGTAGATGPTGPAGATGSIGPQGIQGVAGPTGPQGPAGGAVSGHASFTFVAGITETGMKVPELRLNNATQSIATKVWIWKVDADGLDVTLGLARMRAGWRLYLQDYDDASKNVTYTLTTNGVDRGSYYEFGLALVSATATVPLGKVEFQAIAPGTIGLPPGGTTRQVLAKNAAADYDASWRDPTWLAVKSTQPTAADYGLSTIPVGAVWIQSP